MSRSLDNFIAGSAGGIAQVLAGQPFDMVKVRLQAANSATIPYKNVSDCLTRIVKDEGGPFALWKGSLFPLICVGAAVSIQFGVNEKLKGIVKEITGLQNLGLIHFFECGAITGIVNSAITIPAEHSRIRMQVQGISSKTQYNSSLDCCKKIIQQYGFRGLYKGGVSTVMREASAFGIYFSFYEWFINKMLTPGQSRSDLKMTSVALAGSVTGIAVWLATFPIDVVKTRIQIDSLSNPQFKGTIDCLAKTYKTGGPLGFYKGLSPCLMRAVPANGATFLAYETVSQMLTFTRDKSLNGSFYA
jgi:solute carrier family 25 carnitine/acylcarnitine transporter 20/29